MTVGPELWPSIRNALPLRGKALLLTGLHRSEPGVVEASAVVPDGHPLVVAGAAPSFLGLELGAQAAAAMEALAPSRDRAATSGGVGYLVRVREASFLKPTLPIETTLRVTAELEGAAPPLAVLRIAVAVGEIELVRAFIATYSGAG